MPYSEWRIGDAGRVRYERPPFQLQAEGREPILIPRPGARLVTKPFIPPVVLLSTLSRWTDPIAELVNRANAAAWTPMVLDYARRDFGPHVEVRSEASVKRFEGRIPLFVALLSPCAGYAPGLELDPQPLLELSPFEWGICQWACRLGEKSPMLVLLDPCDTTPVMDWLLRDGNTASRIRPVLVAKLRAAMKAARRLKKQKGKGAAT